MIPLKVKGLIDGAVESIKDGLSLDEYSQMIARVLISGQSPEEVKKHLIDLGIDKIFELMPDRDYYDPNHEHGSHEPVDNVIDRERYRDGGG